MDWSSLAGWWLDEVASDPAYEEEILPLALDLLDPKPGHTYLDVGCGEGRVMKAVAAFGTQMVVGVDVAAPLLRRATRYGPVVHAAVPSLAFVRDESFDGVALVLVMEHLADEAMMLREAARVTRPGGALALVINHPVWTAPMSTPILDESGEILWRPGEYFSDGWSDEPAGDRTVRFHHRSMARLLTAAPRAGWQLERLEERGASTRQVERVPELRGQAHIPRLLGARWTKSVE